MSKTIVFRSDRTPQPGRVHVGFETDNMVERLAFVLPQLDAQQTAMLMLGGTYVNMVQLSEGGGVYCVDMTAELIGKAGEAEGYVVVNTPDGRVWNSAPFVLITGDLPDIDGELQEHFPDAIQQMRQEIAEHNAEMAEQVETAHAAVNAAEAAAKRSEAAAESFVEQDPTVPEWAKQPSKPVYSSEEVGAPSKAAFEALAAEVGKKQPAGDYASKDDIPTVPTKLSAFENDVGYAANLATWAKQPNKPTYTAAEVGAPSKQELNVLAAKVDNKQPKGDYALKSEIPKMTDYATEAWVGTQLAGYQPKGEYQPKGDYALKSELPSVPTMLSELAQDATHRLTTDAEKEAWNAKVTTVNGTAPDANGNVQIEAGGGGVTSWNDLEDRPFGEMYGDTLTINWEPIINDLYAGNVDNYVIVADNFIKMSDATPTLEDFANGCTVVAEGETYTFNAEELRDQITEFMPGVYLFWGIMAIVHENAVGVEIDGISFPEAGFYVAVASLDSITIPGFTEFMDVKQLGEKYIPDGYRNVQSDWAVTDETSAAFIKNKPEVNNIYLEIKKIDGIRRVCDRTTGSVITRDELWEKLSGKNKVIFINETAGYSFGYSYAIINGYGVLGHIDFNINGTPVMTTAYTSEYTPTT